MDDEGRRRIAEELIRDADAYDRGAASEIGAGLQTFEQFSTSSHRKGWKDPGLGAAYTFWDNWVDARNHQWRHYPSMQATDWPIVARQIAATLLAGGDPSPIVRDKVR